MRAQVSKEKADTRVHMLEAESSVWLNRRDVVTAGLNAMTASRGEMAVIYRANLRSKWHQSNRVALGASVIRLFGDTYTGLRLEDKAALNIPFFEEGSVKACGTLGVMRSGNGEYGKAARLEAKLMHWPFGVLSGFFNSMQDATTDTEPFSGTMGIDVVHWREELTVGYTGVLNLEAECCSCSLGIKLNPSTGQGSLNFRTTSNEFAFLGLLAIPALARTLAQRAMHGPID